MGKQFVVADAAYLTANSDNEVVLCVGSLAYGAQDKVPSDLLSRNRLIGGDTAGYFVEQILANRFGEDQSTWPALASAFLADSTPIAKRA